MCSCLERSETRAMTHITHAQQGFLELLVCRLFYVSVSIFAVMKFFGYPELNTRFPSPLVQYRTYPNDTTSMKVLVSPFVDVSCLPSCFPCIHDVCIC